MMARILALLPFSVAAQTLPPDPIEHRRGLLHQSSHFRPAPVRRHFSQPILAP